MQLYRLRTALPARESEEASPVSQQDCTFSEAVPFFFLHKETLRANRPKCDAIEGFLEGLGRR